MRRLRRQAGKTVPAGIEDVLELILRQKSAYDPFQQLRLMRACKERIGVEFGKHMQPDRYASGTLYCTVDSPSWQQQYQFFSAEILKRLNNPPLEVRVSGLRFAVGSLRESGYISDEKIREQTRLAELRKQLPAITPDDIRQLKEMASTVHPDLRQDAARLIDEWVAFLEQGSEEEK